MFAPALPIDNADDIEPSTHIVLVATKDPETKAMFRLSRPAAKLSGMVSAMIDGADPDMEQVVELDEVAADVLAIVVAYMEHHANLGTKPVETPLKGPIRTLVSDFDRDMIYPRLVNPDKEDEHEMLLRVVNAAHYMSVDLLRQLCCCTIASMVQGKSTEQIRTTFHIKNDLTPEQEARIAEEMKYSVEE
jgi:S-phase kinase-associated protein 1